MSGRRFFSPGAISRQAERWLGIDRRGARGTHQRARSTPARSGVRQIAAGRSMPRTSSARTPPGGIATSARARRTAITTAAPDRRDAGALMWDSNQRGRAGRGSAADLWRVEITHHLDTVANGAARTKNAFRQWCAAGAVDAGGVSSRSCTIPSARPTQCRRRPASRARRERMLSAPRCYRRPDYGALLDRRHRISDDERAALSPNGTSDSEGSATGENRCSLRDRGVRPSGSGARRSPRATARGRRAPSAAMATTGSVSFSARTWPKGRPV